MADPLFRCQPESDFPSNKGAHSFSAAKPEAVVNAEMAHKDKNRWIFIIPSVLRSDFHPAFTPCGKPRPLEAKSLFPGLTWPFRFRIPPPRAMIREIVQYGDPVLRQRCRPVTEVDAALVELAADMLETMHDANGVGLAAPQIGIDLRLAVIDVSHDPECISYLIVNGQHAELGSIMPLIFINPELEFGQEKEFGLEGCLSIQGIRSDVRRPAEVRATLPQLDGSVLVVETDGLLARALQHEIDHLNGVLFVDRLPAAAKVSMKNRLRKLLENQESR